MDTMNSGKSRSLRITFNAPVVLGFVAVCVVATAANYITNGAANRLLFSTYRSSLLHPLTYVRLVGHVFGHSGWDHLVANMSYILLLGPLLEEKYGSGTLAAVIALTGITTGLVNSLLFGNIALCGASGVCFAFILLSSVTSFRDGEIPLTFILVAMLFLGQQIMEGIFIRDNISQLAHVLGGLVGAGVGFLLGGRKQ